MPGKYFFYKLMIWSPTSPPNNSRSHNEQWKSARDFTERFLFYLLWSSQPARGAGSVSPLFQIRKWGVTERSDLPKFMQLLSGRAPTWTQGFSCQTSFCFQWPQRLRLPKNHEQERGSRGRQGYQGADAPGFRMQKTQNDSQPLQGPGPTSLPFTTQVSSLGGTLLV